jgi:hypothetical protein
VPSRMCAAAVLVGVSLASCATVKLSPTRDEVLIELSRRSQLPPAQLEPFLASCDRDEQSRFLCAFRAQVEADLKLELVVADKLRELPGCRLTIERKLRRFQHDRDETCGPAVLASALATAELTARVLCANGATQRTIKDVLHETRCRAR